MGMAPWTFERLVNIFGKSTQDILVSLMVKIMIKNILMEM
jgi:hypothetical protein